MISKPQQIHLLGAGCASLSLHHYLRDTQVECVFYGQKTTALEKPHFWGFWKFDWLEDAASLSTKHWQEWQFADHQKLITHHSKNHPYHALKSTDWLTHCISNKMLDMRPIPSTNTDDLVLDSRTPHPPKNSLVQHFIGQIVKTPKPCFNPEKAMLMDFRCDQSRGIHFIYMLPFSTDTALIESTFFSKKLHADETYLNAISDYMRAVVGQPEFTVIQSEKGRIPMAELAKHDPNLLGIGSNGGCLRASSGYAFSFIQKQVSHLATMLANGDKIQQQNQIKNPIRRADRWMDRIFLAVISHHPHQAPKLFMKMAKALTGDEFASFMSGQAGIKTYLKIISAMPKGLFLSYAFAAFKEQS